MAHLGTQLREERRLALDAKVGQLALQLLLGAHRVVQHRREEQPLKVALRQEIGQGLAEVQREKNKVIVTVGAGGAFASGSATLTPEAIEIMNRIASVNAEGSSQIKVSGHTDDVPLIFGSNYRDNWDLAAARSASVVQAFAANGVISDKRLEAISYGESRPVSSNETQEGRAKNRRIEIEINY